MFNPQVSPGLHWLPAQHGWLRAPQGAQEFVLLHAKPTLQALPAQQG